MTILPPRFSNESPRSTACSGNFETAACAAIRSNAVSGRFCLPALSRLRTSLRRAICTAAACLFIVTGSTSVHADDWMYRRSYYSHMPVDGRQPDHPLPDHRSAHRTAYYREAFGFSVRSAFRINNFVLQNGPRTDRTIYQESYIEFQP